MNEETVQEHVNSILRYLNKSKNKIKDWPDWKKRYLGLLVDYPTNLLEPKKLRERVFYYDDDNKEEKPYFCIFKDNQGDYYINIWYTDHNGLKIITPDIRLTASGGAASISPELRRAIGLAHEAMDEVMTKHPRDYKGMV